MSRPTRNVLKTNFRQWKRAARFLALGTLVLAMSGATPEPHRYANGFSITVKIAENLYEALPGKMSDQIDPRPVNMLASDQPFIGPVTLTDENKTSREVSISVGLIDLMNHLAHAKAVDSIEPGFFDRYVKNISLQGGDQLNLPDIVDARYWTESVRNDQMSYFNQMASMLMAINLSHHYLGHYAKYGDKLPRANDLMLPINQFLTHEEWESSVRAGAVNSLSCARWPRAACRRCLRPLTACLIDRFGRATSCRNLPI